MGSGDVICLYVRASCLGSHVRCRERRTRRRRPRWVTTRRRESGWLEHLNCTCTARRALCAAPGHTRVKAVNGTVRVCPLSRPPGVALGRWVGEVVSPWRVRVCARVRPVSDRNAPLL